MKLRALPDELNGEILFSPERHGYDANITVAHLRNNPSLCRF